ncbi:SRPBCC family protein [Nocardia callitridis]|uniref:SRPBCC family protein n=1 Tax=Nocardia callitridis TaxID=648753 RepID=A0ABP9KRQ9_9NOCA
MSESDEDVRVVSAGREIAAEAGVVFELIADPHQQPRWDGNENLVEVVAGQRVREVGDVFGMRITQGGIRDNHVVEFEEGRLIAWLPAEQGGDVLGHLWRWEVEALGPGRSRVTHTYDWSKLTDENRFPKARATTSDRLLASVDRLAEVAESGR